MPSDVAAGRRVAYRGPVASYEPLSREALQKLDDWPLYWRWSAGDRRSAAVLVERYSSLLQRFFRNKVRDTEAVSELISETMLGCLSAVDRAEASGPFRSFLFGVAMNNLRVYIRRSYKRQREVDDFDEVCVGEEADTPTGLVCRHGETRLLVRALRRIPMKFQIVLELQFFEEMSGPDIAELLGMPQATVYTNQRRGKERLQAKLEELAESPGQAQSTLVGLETWVNDIRAQVTPEPHEQQ